jgi:hypothetical protein
MQFKDIGEKGIVVDMDSADLLLLGKVCRATLAGDLPEHEQATIDAMGAAFEAAALCEWLGASIVDTAGLTLAALREAGSIDAAIEERSRSKKNGK